MSFEAKKITDLMKDKTEHITFSYEVTPDITDNDLSVMKKDPLFFAVTWHPKTYQFENLDIPPVKKAELLRNKPNQVMAHISCERMTKKYLLNLLNDYKKEGIRNFLCILGENYSPDTSDFKSTNELITFIKEVTGDYFCVGVAGFPESDDNAMKRLKDKVDNGADFIVTQAFFEPYIFGEFLSKCEKFNIKVPVLPGIFVFETEEELKGFVNKVKCKVSDNFLELAKDKLAQNYTGTDVIGELIQEIHQKWKTNHFHLFTLNKFGNINMLLNKSKI